MSDDQLSAVIERMKQIIAQHEQNVIDVTPVDAKPDKDPNDVNDLQFAKLGCERCLNRTTFSRL
jgi:hypothetical protein